jgi:ribosome-associated translation inhibitor RaiA
MQTTITARHCEISDALRERAVTVAAKMEALAPRPLEMAIVFDTDGTGQVVELRMLNARREPYVARGEAPDHRSALDRAEDKLRKQLERGTGRPRRSHPSAIRPH